MPLIPAWIAAASLRVTMMAVVPLSKIAREVLSGTEKRDGEVELLSVVSVVAAAAAAASAPVVAASAVAFFAASTSVPFPPECLIPFSCTVQYPLVATGAHVISPTYREGSTPPSVSLPAGSLAGSLDSHHANTLFSIRFCLTMLVNTGTLRITDKASNPKPTSPSQEVALKSCEASRTIPKGCLGTEMGGLPSVIVSTAEEPVAAPVPYAIMKGSGSSLYVVDLLG